MSQYDGMDSEKTSSMVCPRAWPDTEVPEGNTRMVGSCGHDIHCAPSTIMAAHTEEINGQTVIFQCIACVLTNMTKMWVDEGKPDEARKMIDSVVEAGDSGLRPEELSVLYDMLPGKCLCPPDQCLNVGGPGCYFGEAAS